ARLRAFEAAAGPWARGRLASTLVGPDVEASRTMRAAVEQAANRAVTADADGWYVAASHTIKRLHDVELDLTVRLDATAAEVLGRARANLVITAVLAAGALALTIGVTALVAADLGRRLRRLRAAALALADERLPRAIEAIGAAPDPVTARTEQLAEHDLGDPDGADEIGDVASALSVVHARALDLATGQALLRRESAAVFEAMARRGQTLVAKQLDLIDRLEAGETDPDTLGWLYRLDHLASRMRRNDESLLILAGGEPVRRFGSAIPLHDVIRGALAETEEYKRVQPIALPAMTIVAEAVSDLVHLIAELLENATHHSPPDTPVVVRAYAAGPGCTVTIQDLGRGMDSVALEQANARLARPGEPVAGPAGTMGLLVVARLAARHDVGVRLSSRGGGVLATVRIPPKLITGEIPRFGAAPGPERTPIYDGLAVNGSSDSHLLPDRLGWVLARFADRVPGVAHAVAVSAEGAALASTGALTRERSEHLIAAVDGMAGLTAGAARSLATGQVRQTAVDMDDGALLTFTIGSVLLGVLAHRGADYGRIAYEAGALGRRIAVLMGSASGAAEPRPWDNERQVGSQNQA
ncbi:roadblock/LC7 domain-containing protein, partial [Nonomuraea lactucae]|uniref:roadblock/LC7 domain-containing protein n=1 Tax=Nonomuraea lactucae TaxID=2249762 RepID=UPI0019653654